MKKGGLVFSMLISTIGPFLSSQELLPKGGGEYTSPTFSTCLSTAQREEIQSMLNENAERLKNAGILNDAALKSNAIVAFDWPLQKKEDLPFNSFYATNNYVDHDPGPGLDDYNCEARTYNGHRGTDIDTWPFPWYIYDQDYVTVNASEAGTIIGKTDGNDDDHCWCQGDWNAVFIQHADGSRAWYGHLKKNSLTAKSVGSAVAKGEYLGVVASSGCSTQPHLHFEVYNAANNLIDPYSGPCNRLVSSWWSSQPKNREPTLNALLTHGAIPEHGCPGSKEEPNISNTFLPGQSLIVATYYHDQLLGDVSQLRIRKPDKSIWKRWNHTSNNTYTKSWWYWTWTLPQDAPLGSWTFEVDYQGESFSHSFQVTNMVGVSPIVRNEVGVSPNPTKGEIEITGPEKGEVIIFDVLGRIVFEDSFMSSKIDLSALPNGIYFMLIKYDKQISIRRVIIE